MYQVRKRYESTIKIKKNFFELMLYNYKESLLPELRNLDPKNVSIDELIYERRVLEDRILDLRKTKLEE